jgi:penicillin-binding protein 2
MYDRRIKIFIILSALLLVVCLLRLAQMQLLTASSVQHEIAELKRQRGQSIQLKTIRGRILDRKGRVLALDEPQFHLCIDYELSQFLDERIWQAKLLRAAGAAQRAGDDEALLDMRKELEAGRDDLEQIIDKCTAFGLARSDIEAAIMQIDDRIWNLRTFLAWRRNSPDPAIIEKYGGRIGSVRLSEAIADLKKNFPDQRDRLVLIGQVDDIPEMRQTSPLVELKTDDDIFAAQLEFLDVQGVEILPGGKRSYPYGTVAAHTIGWVGPATQQQDKELFADDRLLSYMSGETCGREDGVEYVCEAVLRGRRGELAYDIDSRLISRTETRFGEDVSLTLDIELQQRIEDYLAGYNHDPNCGPGMAAVVIDVGTSDILALVSLPVFDLNRARYDYDALKDDPDRPLINRAIYYDQYPPGSVVKPLILIAGLETGHITSDEVIGCPPEAAPPEWPNCWIYNQNPWTGHDHMWQNHARNAVRGSCNIYFSQLADRIEPELLQRWLFKFGYGHSLQLVPTSLRASDENRLNRNLRQWPGIISSSIPARAITRFEDVPPLSERERKLFGIGQGNLRATPLQVANAMAAIARGGIFTQPRLFAKSQDIEISALGISPETLSVVCDGMSAVISEYGGTAYRQFQPVLSILTNQDVKVYGKTGSTERPDHAWFAGFAEDSTSRKLAIAVVVEGGQSGPRHAAPLAIDILQFCIEAEYIGKAML